MLRERQALRHSVDGDDPLRSQQKALLMAICPTGPHPQIATVSPPLRLQKSAAM